MPITRLASPEAIVRAADAGLVHIDVRSEPEFAAGHAPHAYNVPLMHMGPASMLPNNNFARDIERSFPDKDTPILVSCKAGGRSAKAAAILESLGYRNVSDHVGGWGGGNGDPGWVASGGPVTEATAPGHSYGELSR